MAKQLELAQMIQDLRIELAKAQKVSVGEAIRFSVEDIDLELDIAVEERVEGTIAAKFYVLTSQLKASRKDAVTQKIKLKLKPLIEDPEKSDTSDKPLKVGGVVSGQE